MLRFDWNSPFQISTHSQQVLTTQALVPSFSSKPKIRATVHLPPDSTGLLTSTSDMSFNDDFQLQTSANEELYQQILNTDFTMPPQTSYGIYTEETLLDPQRSWSVHASQQVPNALPFAVLPPDPTSLIFRYTSPFSSPKLDHPREQEKPSMETCRIESTNRPRAFPCPNCGKQFGRRAELNRHRNSVHPEKLESQPVLYPCKYLGCSRSGMNGFKRKDNYIQHLRGPHNETIKKSRRSRQSTVNTQSLNQLCVSGTNSEAFEVFDQSL